MKQVLQDVRTGEVAVAEVPSPKVLPGCVLVRMAASLVSAGTERASSEFARKNLLQKAKARPDLVREVMAKIQRDGLFSALGAVRNRLDQPSALGYSSAGTVVGAGEGVNDLRPGDRVACAGAGFAVHAEFACVPRLLTAPIPGGEATVSFEEAAFTTVGAVALHGMRTAEAKLGDVVAIIGLGLLGQLTVQILKAAGCRVLGMDIAPGRAALALRLGAEAACTTDSEFRDLCRQASGGQGADSVIIAAETSSSAPVHLAAEVARDRGIVVSVGVVGLELDRRPFYEKELDFRVARSYGPGRYDVAYEQKGRDYPIGYVRWTETRNMQAFLQLLAGKKLDLQSLITHRFPVESARGAYELITGEAHEPHLGVLITYSEEAAETSRVEVRASAPNTAGRKEVSLGLLGAGGFAMSTLLPAIKQISGVEFAGVCAANGSHARHAADKFGFRYCATDEAQILEDAAVSTIAIATRHNLHAVQVLNALHAGKHVFCEKPLCLREEELAGMVTAYSAANSLLMVGFNRRFAPMAVSMKKFLAEIQEPLAMHYRVNAGYLAPDHWLNDPEQGGGRMLGEVCHFVDFLSFLAGAPPVEVQTRALANSGQYSGDNVAVSLQFANGSQGAITYLANGDRRFSKERIEVFGGGSVAVLEDFRSLELIRHGRKRIFRSRLRQDKGHRAEWQAFASAIRNGSQAPISFAELVATTLATLAAENSRLSGQPVRVDAAAFIASHSSR